MSDFSLVLQMAALGTGFCFLMTTLGAASVLFTGKESSPAFQRISLGFAAGIMVAASVWSLLIPSLEASSKDAIPWLPATGGFVLGIAFLLLMDKTIPHWHPAEDSPEGPKSNHSRTELLVAAVTLHNIPEGMSVGLAFAMAAITGEASTLSAAGALALGIGIQNIPEGAAVALPLKDAGQSRVKAFIGGSLSGIVEPIFGILVVFAASFIQPYMPWLLGFAAGAMMFVVVEELIPAAHLEAPRLHARCHGRIPAHDGARYLARLTAKTAVTVKKRDRPQSLSPFFFMQRLPDSGGVLLAYFSSVKGLPSEAAFALSPARTNVKSSVFTSFFTARFTSSTVRRLMALSSSRLFVQSASSAR